MKPLNGEKTHPLTLHSLDVLTMINTRPMPRQEVNPGVANRLEREALVETVDLPSPYKVHKGGMCAHLKITPAGRSRLGF